MNSIKEQGAVDYLINSYAHEDHIAFNYLFGGQNFAPMLLTVTWKLFFLREERLIDFLRKGPKNLVQFVQEGIICGGKTISAGPWDLTLSKKIMMAKHLDRLIRMSRVQKERDFFILVR